MAFAQIKPAKINLSLFGRLSFPKVEDERRAVLLLSFDQDVVDMGLDGAHGKEELVSDLLVRFAQHNQTHDFGFAVGELVGVAIEGICSSMCRSRSLTFFSSGASCMRIEST